MTADVDQVNCKMFLINHVVGDLELDGYIKGCGFSAEGSGGYDLRNKLLLCR